MLSLNILAALALAIAAECFSFDAIFAPSALLKTVIFSALGRLLAIQS